MMKFITIMVLITTFIVEIHSAVPRFRNHKYYDNGKGNELSQKLPRKNNSAGYRPNVCSFQPMQLVGEGGFGKVYQVQQKSSKKIFAMKIVKKQRNDRKKTEKKILATVKSPFLCRMFYYFETRRNEYYVLEFLNGGSLHDLLVSVGPMSENEAMFYIAELTLAIEYLHNRHIIHRDIKPENVMLDKNGHVKLTDFGASRVLNPGRKATVSWGTPAYKAPEMVNFETYDHSADIWSLGILMYELLTGYTPFESDSEDEQEQNILYGEFDDPEGLSDEGIDLLRRLLSQDPEMRPTIPEIKESAFFDSINWTKMKARRYRPSFQLDVRSDEDASQFDRFYTDQPLDGYPCKSAV